jgi:oxygen-dependent protoporphyrinogen oxidase
MHRHIAVVGGGVAGLAAALRLTERAPAGTEITLYEQSGAPGGKLRTGAVAGATVEYGAEAFLTRDPAGGDSAAVELARQLGLADQLVHPATIRAAVAFGGGLHPMPAGTLMGVPGDLAALPPLAHATAAADRDEGRPLLGPGEDVSVGGLVRARLGDEPVDRLVDPMLGGVYAGRADDLSLTVTMPALARACRTEHTLLGAVNSLLRAPRPATAGPPAPIFTTLSGGMSRLVDAMTAAVRADLRLGLPVRELRRTAEGWELVIGPTSEPRRVRADAVVLAVPGHPAARLLSEVHARASALVGELDYASVALVTMALPAGTVLPEGLSGVLVPAVEGTAVKAATFFTTKWAHVGAGAGGLTLVRASIGRYGEEHVLQRPDGELVATAHAELNRLLAGATPGSGAAGPLPAPVDAHVQRWGGALPQYRPGHADRVAAARAGLAAEHPTLALAGAGYDGVGIPMCIRSGQTAADHVLKALGERRD